MKSKAIIAAALVAACAWGQYVQTSRLGALGRNSTVVTGVDMTPATNYTDAIAAAFENGDRSVQYANNSGHTDYAVQLYNEDASGLYNASDLIRASTNAAKAVAGPVAVAATNYTDAVAAEFEDGTRTVGYANNSGHTDFAVQLYNEDASGLYNASDLMRASTNAAKAVVGPATNAVLQAALGAAASKQDALPYPTNAIPYAVIDGAPSGAPVWQVVSFDANTSLSFVTNGMAVKAVNGELFCDRTGWPDGAAMFTRITLVPGDYDIDSHIRLVGYGTWPTNNFQSVWWRSGATIYVNILVEE